MDYDCHPLGERQFAGEECIEDNCETDDSDREQSSMPGLTYVVVVIDDDKSLYNCADHEAYTCEKRMVPDRT